MELKDVLVKLREDRGWSKAEAARQIGMDRTQYLRMENGDPKRPHYETLVKIADAYGIKPLVLLEATGQTITEARGSHAPDVESDELAQLFDRLPDADRDRLIAIARALYQLSRDR